jgi:flagellin-like protein
MKHREEPPESGVSPVVGVVLMLAIVVALAGVLAVLLGVFSPPSVAPTIGTDSVVITLVDGTTGAREDVIQINQYAGESIDTDDVDVIISSGGSTLSNVPLSNSQTQFSPGDALSYNVTAADLCSLGGDDVQVTMAHLPSETVISSNTFEVDRSVNISVVDNKVTADRAFKSKVSMLGSGYATLEGSNYVYWPIEARIILSNKTSTTTLTPWPDGDPYDALSNDVDDDINSPVFGFPYTYETNILDADSAVVIELRSYKKDDWVGTGTYRTHGGNTYEEARSELDQYIQSIDTSDPNEDNLLILKDGDVVPNTGAASHQDSVPDILQSRIDPSTGELQLSDNERVIVFEINEPANSGDFNDAVGLIEIVPTGSVEVIKSRQTLTC